MKRVLALILATLIVETLLDISFNSVEIANLRQEVESLQSELSQLKEQISELNSTNSDEELQEIQIETSDITPSENLTNITYVKLKGLIL